MANLVLASKRELKSGMFWHVYRSENNNKSEEFYFANPLKALRYAFILRKRFNAIIPKGVYGKLMADVKASKPESTGRGVHKEEGRRPLCRGDRLRQVRRAHTTGVI